MMVMAGFEDKQVEFANYKFLKEANIPFIPVKGNCNSNKCKLDIMQLLKNVKTEYMELTGMNKDMIN